MIQNTIRKMSREEILFELNKNKELLKNFDDKKFVDDYIKTQKEIVKAKIEGLQERLKEVL